MRRTNLGLLLLLLLTGIFNQKTNATKNTSELEAIKEVRAHFFNREYGLGTIKGNRYLKKYQGSQELLAWYITNIAYDGNDNLAIQKADSMLSAYPENPWSYFAITTATAEDRERWKESMETVETAYRMKPEHPDFIWLKAVITYKHVGKEEALAFINESIANFPNPEDLISLKASAYISLSYQKQGNEADQYFQDALNIFQDLRQNHPKFINAYYLPGRYLNSKRKINEALPLLKKAATLTKSVDIHFEYWRMVTNIDSLSTEEKHEIITNDVNDLMANTIISSKLLARTASIYEMVGDLETKEKYEEQLLSDFPGSLDAEWVYVGRYRDFVREHQKEIYDDKNPELIGKYESMLWDFLALPTHNRETLLGDAYRGLYFTVSSDSVVRPDTLLMVINGMAKYEGINYHITHAAAPITLSEKTDFDERALELTEKGLILAKQDVTDDFEAGYFDEEKYKERLDMYTALMYDAKGWVYYQMANYDSSKKYLSLSHSFNPENAQTKFHLGQLFEKEKQFKLAERYYIDGFKTEMRGENPNKSALRLLFVDKTGSEEGFENYLASLQDESNEKRQQEVMDSMLENPEPLKAFSLRDLNGNEYSSSEMKGKIAVVNLWGVWCGPCVAEMPDIQRLYDQHKDNPEVLIITINNDPNIETVKKWMSEKEFDFPVLRDKGYLSDQDIYSYPTTWFIDRNGDIRFIKNGYTEKLVEEFNWRIDILSLN